MTLLLFLFTACGQSGTAGDSGADTNGDEDAAGLADTSESEVIAPATTNAGLVINEVVCAAEDGGTDWIELYAAGTDPVDLSAFTLVDDNPDHAPAALPEVTLQPGEYYVILAIDADDEVFAPSVPFKLGGDDGVWLAMAGEVVDSLDWDEDAAPEGSSWGRLPDGTTTVARLTPTPGEANVAWDGTEPEPDPEDCDLFPQDRVMTIVVTMADDAWQSILTNPEDEEYQEATLTIDGVATEQLAVRTKGNSSLNSVAGNPNSERYSWKIDTNRYVDGQKVCGLKKFNLNNGFKDPTLIREHIGYQLATEIGLPSPRTAFADVTINGQHLGLYTVVEHVDSEFIERWFDDDTGDLYKPDWPDGTLQYKGDQFTDYEGIDIETNEDTTDHSALMTLLATLNTGDDDAVDA
ncbi:MAG: CotH kinase family protein, partial [Myxococcota bacterium]|nr:CotH kinase family protein [Myxococcota bacterium]